MKRLVVFVTLLCVTFSAVALSETDLYSASGGDVSVFSKEYEDGSAIAFMFGARRAGSTGRVGVLLYTNPKEDVMLIIETVYFLTSGYLYIEKRKTTLQDTQGNVLGTELGGGTEVFEASMLIGQDIHCLRLNGENFYLVGK